jgi:dihydroxy-acid dehydratase
LAAGGDIRNHEVIRSREDAYHAEGGIAALKGNIAHSAIIKQTVVDSDMLAHTITAKVYHFGKALLDTAEAKRIAEGDVLVLPYQEPSGAPACRKC